MKKISVDIENLESAVSYFVFAFKELEEMQYRLKQIGNEMADDVDLNMAPEFEAIMQLYYEALDNTNKLYQILEGLSGVLINIPELYAAADAKSADRVNEIISKSFDYESKNFDFPLNKTMADIDDKSASQLIDLIEKNLKDLTFADILTSANQGSTDKSE